MLGGMEMSWCARCHLLEQIQQSQQRQIEGHCLTQSVLESHELRIGNRCRNTLTVMAVVVQSLQPTWTVRRPPQGSTYQRTDLQNSLSMELNAVKIAVSASMSALS